MFKRMLAAYTSFAKLINFISFRFIVVKNRAESKIFPKSGLQFLFH